MVNIIDRTQEAGFGNRFGELNNVQGIVLHHTGGGGDVNGVINTFQERGLPAQYVIDQQGNVYQTLPNGAKGQQIVSSSGQYTGLNNSNTIGIEIIGANDSAWTPAQIEAARGLTSQLQQQYNLPQTAVYGHSELNPRDRTNEGATLAQSIRTGAPYSAPSTAMAYAGNSFGATGQTPPPTPRLRPGDTTAPASMVASAAPMPLPPTLASFSPQPTPTPAAVPDNLGGGQSPLRTVNMAEDSTIASGPYGADAVIRAGMSGDPVALKAAMDAVVTAAIKKDSFFGVPNLPAIKSNLTNYFDSVQAQSPGAIRQLQTALATNPRLNAAVPDTLRPMLESAFGKLPPVPTAQMPLPNLRPPMPSAPLVASTPMPPLPLPLTPQMASYTGPSSLKQDVINNLGTRAWRMGGQIDGAIRADAAAQSGGDPVAAQAMGTISSVQPTAAMPSISSYGMPQSSQETPALSHGTAWGSGTPQSQPPAGGGLSFNPMPEMGQSYSAPSPGLGFGLSGAQEQAPNPNFDYWPASQPTSIGAYGMPQAQDQTPAMRTGAASGSGLGSVQSQAPTNGLAFGAVPAMGQNYGLPSAGLGGFGAAAAPPPPPPMGSWLGPGHTGVSPLPPPAPAPVRPPQQPIYAPLTNVPLPHLRPATPQPATTGLLGSILGDNSGQIGRGPGSDSYSQTTQAERDAYESGQTDSLPDLNGMSDAQNNFYNSWLY